MPYIEYYKIYPASGAFSVIYSVYFTPSRWIAQNVYRTGNRLSLDNDDILGHGIVLVKL